MRGRWRPAAALVAIAIGTALVLALGGLAAASPREAWACRGNGHACATAQRGVAGKVDLVLGLRRRQQALNGFARRVSRPGSARYGRYLAPRQVGRRFGASKRVSKAVRGFLRRRGIESRIDVTRGFVEALPPSGKAKRLFGGISGRKRVPRKLRGKVRQVLIGTAAPDQYLPPRPRLRSGAMATSPGEGGANLKPPHARTG